MARAPTVEGRQAEAARTSADKVVDMHLALADFLHEGVTLPQIDAFVAQTLDRWGAKSCFFRYSAGRMPPFPSHSCLSVNDCVVHGRSVDLDRPLQQGDVLSIDIGVSYHGWLGDAAWTYVFGEPSEDVRYLTDTGKQSLKVGVAALKPGAPWLAWAEAVQGYVEGERGLHLVRGLGGHGYGKKLHTPPFVSNVVPRLAIEWPEGGSPMRPGTLVALEPMIAVGTGRTEQEPKGWPIYTADGSLSVHYEHDVLITEDGADVLTKGLEQVNDVILR